MFVNIIDTNDNNNNNNNLKNKFDPIGTTTNSTIDCKIDNNNHKNNKNEINNKIISNSANNTIMEIEENKNDIKINKLYKINNVNTINNTPHKRLESDSNDVSLLKFRKLESKTKAVSDSIDSPSFNVFLALL